MGAGGELKGVDTCVCVCVWERALSRAPVRVNGSLSLALIMEGFINVVDNHGYVRVQSRL